MPIRRLRSVSAAAIAALSPAAPPPITRTSKLGKSKPISILSAGPGSHARNGKGAHQHRPARSFERSGAVEVGAAEGGGEGVAGSRGVDRHDARGGHKTIEDPRATDAQLHDRHLGQPFQPASARFPAGATNSTIAPVGSSLSTALTSTPPASISATRRRPSSSVPIRVISRACSPRAADQAQKLAAWPRVPIETTTPPKVSRPRERQRRPCGNNAEAGNVYLLQNARLQDFVSFHRGRRARLLLRPSRPRVRGESDHRLGCSNAT